VIGILGILHDGDDVLKVGFREEGDVILLLDGAGASNGTPRAAPPPAAQEFSSSEYSKTIGGIVAGEPPAIDLAAEKRLIDCLVALAEARAVQSAHDLSDGGLAVAVAESCFTRTDVVGARHAAPQLGAIVEIKEDGPAEFSLFGERGARTIVSVSQGNVAAVLRTARQYGVGAREIGKVTRDNTLRIESMGRAVIASAVPTLKDAWAHALERNLKLP